MIIPTHIAIIPDGNRRWARKKGLPTLQGHKYAAEKTLPDLLEKASNIGIKYFTFWALSTENLKKRTKNEVQALLSLMKYFLKNKVNEFKKKDIKLMTIGDLKKLPQDIQSLISKSIKETEKNKKMTVIFGINYGGRDEVIRAINKVKSQKSKVKRLTEEQLNKYLDTAGIPDPDMIIRTGGEKRLSGFLPWQSVYSELYFSELFFPDFKARELEKAVEDYSFRQRRFGK